jgi:hypothetical protein
MTSWPSPKAGLRNAGADLIDQAVVEDVLLVTSRKADDIPTFNEAIIPLFSSASRADCFNASSTAGLERRPTSGHLWFGNKSVDVRAKRSVRADSVINNRVEQRNAVAKHQ